MTAQSAKNWFKRLAPYRQADDRRAILEVIITIVPFLALWLGMRALIGAGHYWALIGVIPAGGMIVRLFIIQHDCGHMAMFSNRKVNDWVGRVLGILTFTPYDYWKRQHALHHAGSGNLDRRGIGDDITTLTVAEYEALGRFDKLKYRLYRHPVVMFGIGPAYLFLLAHRLPLGALKGGVKPWASAMLTNLGLLVFYALVIWAFGVKSFFLITIPIVIVGATIGIWMFYIQHQFEDAHWNHNEEWSREEAALFGSSYYDLPKPLMWITGNIGIHHIHHLSSRIPFYTLPKVLKDFPELADVGRMNFAQSLECVKYTLWDEAQRRMIGFKTLKARRRAAA